MFEMRLTETEDKMEGWLYVIRSNRIRMQFSRKRYFVLEDNCLKFFKSMPLSQTEVPVSSAVIDSSIRIMDNGRESINRKVLFMFTLYNTLNHKDQLKLGASRPEEAARWIHSLRKAALKGYSTTPQNDFLVVSSGNWGPRRLRVSKKEDRRRSIDFSSPLRPEGMTNDVIEPSPWKIFGCQNGLRLFKEANDSDSHGGHWENNPAIMAVVAVDGTAEAIFQTLMSVGPSRSEWDFCFYRGSVVEHLDGHSDIIHKQLYNDWMPWGMRRRDLLLRRYWRRDDDGSYVILYNSVIHDRRPPQKGYIRAIIKSGGYVVTPVDGSQSVVKHMLSVDWKVWKAFIYPRSEISITIRMLERVAALREFFRTKPRTYSSDFMSGEFPTSGYIPEMKSGEIMEEANSSTLAEDEKEKGASTRTSLLGFTDAYDDFLDLPEDIEMMEYELENSWSGTQTPLGRDNFITPQRVSPASGYVNKLHDLAVHKNVNLEVQDKEEGRSYRYGTTLEIDPTGTIPCSCTTADPSTFLIRGKNYLKDRIKFKAKGTLMELVGADWLRSEQPLENLAGRPDSIVQKYAEEGRSEFFFIVNMALPGLNRTTITSAFYYMLKAPLEETPLLYNFVNADDAFRNSRFKMIPFTAKGSWIAKQSIGKKACLVGQLLDLHYFHGKNYIEVFFDSGTSSITRGIMSVVHAYMTNLVSELAFLIQGNTEEELPEVLLGTCRLSYPDIKKTVAV